ncbi:hypothetical protein KS2013_517 [Kangiella sediminilitoris]|uniref:Uncharacterized protein n=1 Tax=Kangiella sediminilitoris TaxID=1144748 RepID=A0A1B3B8Y7_9GAMM|nr:hypothetical protein KS2013_517 [Kangiella sediminilitoris]
MIISLDVLDTLVLVAMGVTCLSPIILIILLIRDWLKEELW